MFIYILMIFSKDMINFCIFIFILIVILLLVSFLLYYSLPNNYIIYNNILNGIKPLKKIKIDVKPYDTYILKYCKYNNIILKFITDEDNYPIKVLLDNFLKSQNLCIRKNTFLQMTNNSDLIIINTTDTNINIELHCYSIEVIETNKSIETNKLIEKMKIIY
jgi:hypothetical protein